MEQVPARKIVIKPRRKLNGKGLLKLIIFVAVIIYFGYIAFNFIVQSIDQQLVKVEPVKMGTIKDSVDVGAFLIKDELVINAPNKGKIRYNVQEGERVRSGAPVTNIVVADINSRAGQSVIAIYAPVPGVISYHIDSMENIYTVANIDTLIMPKAEKMDNKTLVINNGDDVGNGHPVFKIVNNLARNRIYFRISQKNLPPDFLKKGKRIEVNFDDKTVEPMIFEVDQIKTSGNDYNVILGNNSFVNEFLNRRQIKIQLVKDTFNGAIIPTKALVRKEGKNGIYIQYKEAVKWVPVDIVGSVEDKTAITGVSEETPYIVNPERTKEGKALYQ